MRRIYLALVVLLPGCSVASSLHGGEPTLVRVGRWERFEAAVTNSRGYRDPFRDVTLQVAYTRPDGSRIEFPGFHDGGATWRLRFMPDAIGRWRYEARFSDGAAGAAGEFECVPSRTPGMIEVHPANPIWFGHRGGGAVLLRSLHVGDRFFARNWDDQANPGDGEARTRFLDWAQAQGYNMLSIASHYLNRRVAGRGEGWETPKLWPLDAAEFRSLELMLDDLARRGLVVFPFAGFFGKSSGFPTEPAEQELYVRYTLSRLAPYWNLTFSVAGPEPNLPKENYLSDADVHRLGRLIRRLDVFGHPLSVHNRTGLDPFRDSDWSSFGTVQGPKTLNRVTLATRLRESHHARKPLYAQETLWPGNRVGHPVYGDEDIRKNAFTILFSGAVLNYGDMDGNSSSGFSASLDPATAVAERHRIVRAVWDTFATLPWAECAPANDLVSTGVCLARPAEHYLVYLDAPRAVTVRLPGGGEFRATWIDARSGRRQGGGTMVEASELRPPEGGDDWILHLERVR